MEIYAAKNDSVFLTKRHYEDRCYNYNIINIKDITDMLIFQFISNLGGNNMLHEVSWFIATIS